MTEDEGVVSLRALARGRTQGVGFRMFVVQHARRLGLRGYVRNLSDGTTVETVAEGPRPALEALLAEIRRGPSMAYVERVDVTWGSAGGGYSDFGTRY